MPQVPLGPNLVIQFIPEELVLPHGADPLLLRLLLLSGLQELLLPVRH